MVIDLIISLFSFESLAKDWVVFRFSYRRVLADAWVEDWSPVFWDGFVLFGLWNVDTLSDHEELLLVPVMNFPHSFGQICDKLVSSGGWSLLDLVNLPISHAHNSVCKRLETDIVSYHYHRDLLLLV